MFKAKEFKEIIGFDHTWFIIITIVISGIAFPFVFLNDNWNSYLNYLWINIIAGLFFASIIMFGNLYIFYHLRKNHVFNPEDEWQNCFIHNSLYHGLYTLIATVVLTYLTRTVCGQPLDAALFLRSVIGNFMLVAIMVGVYESSFYMNALSKSIRNEEQLKRDNIESQLEILKNQVKPHFLFNSLNTLTSLIPDEPNKAIEYVQKLSKVYRYILEIKDKKLIPLKEELNCVKAFLFMLEIRFGTNLSFEIDESGLDFNHHIVPLSLQLLVENAVKHNIISNRKPLHIKIHKGKNGSLLVCNNLQAKTHKLPSTGTGLVNIKSRYEILSQKIVDVIVTDQHFTVSLPLLEVA